MVIVKAEAEADAAQEQANAYAEKSLKTQATAKKYMTMMHKCDK